MRTAEPGVTPVRDIRVFILGNKNGVGARDFQEWKIIRHSVVYSRFCLFVHSVF